MRAIAYEVRRLRGLRSSWLILATVLLSDCVVAAVLTRQLPSDELVGTDAVRAVTAAVPLLPLPIAALGAGVLGALSYSHEVRHPSLPAILVATPSRLRLLAGKLAVIGAVCALLAAASLLLDTAVLRFALAPETDPGPVLALVTDPAATSALVLFVAVAAAAGCAGLLLTSLVRSAAAGVLILAALPAVLAPALTLLLRAAGLDRPGLLRELLPFQYGLDWPHGVPQRAAAAQSWEVLVAGLTPALALLATAVLVQARRRAC